eukprot:785588-Prymnesium_polylepis.1
MYLTQHKKSTSRDKKTPPCRSRFCVVASCTPAWIRNLPKRCVFHCATSSRIGDGSPAVSALRVDAPSAIPNPCKRTASRSAKRGRYRRRPEAATKRRRANPAASSPAPAAPVPRCLPL